MVEQFINDFVTSLYGVISDKDLDSVTARLRVALNDYELTKKETGIVPYEELLPDCYKVYMVSKRLEGKSEKTLELYKMYLEDMFLNIGVPLKEITPNSIKVYLYNVQKQRGISNRTLNSRRGALSSFFAWASAEEYIDRNPMVNIKPIKYTSEERKPLNDTELELVRESCKTLREKALIEFFYSTGCRVTEAERMNISDINFATKEVILFGKGDKYRKSYLTAKAMLLIQQYLESRTDNSDALFVSDRKPYTRLTKNGIEKIISKIGDRAGVDRLHPHLIRHTMATNCLQHGMDVTQVQQILGHSSINTTMIYAKVDSSDIQRTHKKCIC